MNIEILRAALVFSLEDFPPSFSLEGGRAAPRVSSKFTSVTGSWCNALLDALEHTTGCDSGLRDVSQFPGRCVRASPAGGLHLPVWDPWEGRSWLPCRQKGYLQRLRQPPSELCDISFHAPGAGRFSAVKEAFS